MEEGRTYKALFTRAVATVQRGTESEIKNFIRHAENGCYDDPFTAIDMVVDSRAYLPNKGHVLMPLFRLRGTDMIESTNWSIKCLVLDSTRLTAAVVHMRLDIRVTQFNLFKDNSLQHIIGKDSRAFDWYWKEAITAQGRGLLATEAFNGSSFPPSRKNGSNSMAGQTFPAHAGEQLWTWWPA
jgi:hypothetical protein